MSLEEKDLLPEQEYDQFILELCTGKRKLSPHSTTSEPIERIIHAVIKDTLINMDFAAQDPQKNIVLLNSNLKEIFPDKSLDDLLSNLKEYTAPITQEK